MNKKNIDSSGELLGDCLKRISEGDPCAAFDLSQFFLAHIDDEDVRIPLAVIEGLVRQSIQLGSDEAEFFLSDQWPSLRNIMIKRLTRKKGQ